ncbi:MAG: C25 family cysteine peptidase, partial [Acidobacteriota bacterium]
LLTNGDVPTLTNARTPIVTSMTCHINHHSLPGFDTLGELLVVEPTAGAVAVFAPVTLSDHVEGRFFGDRLFRRAFPRRGESAGTFGDVLSQAFADAVDAGIPPHVLHVYQLLGDPALALRHTPNVEEQVGTVSGPG